MSERRSQSFNANSGANNSPKPSRLFYWYSFSNLVLGFVGRRLRQRVRCRVAVFGGVALSSSIALVVHAGQSDLPYPPRMAELCAKNGGWHIYQTADDVRGYFLAGHYVNGVRDQSRDGCPALDASNLCLSALISHDFEFVETEVSEATEAEPKELVDKPGLYRFTLEKPGHPNCRIFDRVVEEKKKSPARSRFLFYGDRKKLLDHCVATTPISRIESRYAVYSNHYLKFHKDKYGSISMYKVKIVDTKSNLTIAVYHDHAFKPSSLWHHSFVEQCRNVLQSPDHDIRKILRMSK